MKKAQAGDVFLHKKIPFSDGEFGKKLFIVINSPLRSKENYLVCKTTSKARPPYRIRKKGVLKNFLCLVKMKTG